MLAGAVNSVAGGGTLLTFPALLLAGQSALFANATSTVALWPGQLSSLWGYRKEIGRTHTAVLPLTVLGTLGGILGAWLLLITPASTFDKIVPFLVLTATSLFMAQEPLARYRARQALQTQQGQEKASPGNISNSASIPSSIASSDNASSDADSPGAASAAPTDTLRNLTLPIALLSFCIAVYGGYFGAGIGILILATLGFLGFTNIHQMNGVKNIFTLCINGVAALIFVAKGLVHWDICALMAVGAIFGGYAGAGIARRIGQKNVRRLVIGIGFILTLSLLWNAWGAKSASNNVIPPINADKQGEIHVLSK